MTRIGDISSAVGDKQCGVNVAQSKLADKDRRSKMEFR
jgi:hypothetical protein